MSRLQWKLDRSTAAAVLAAWAGVSSVARSAAAVVIQQHWRRYHVCTKHEMSDHFSCIRYRFLTATHAAIASGAAATSAIKLLKFVPADSIPVTIA